MKKIGLFVLFLLFTNIIFAQKHVTKQSHMSTITAIEKSTHSSAKNTFFTASDDGFLIKWNENGDGEHYQVTNLWIKDVACSPNGNDVAIYETDGASINMVTVWDWKKLKKKFQKKYSDSITTLKYSAKGSYLIVGTSSMDGAEFLNASNYSVVSALKENTNIINYVWTSETEKSIAFYSTSGNFSIYNLQTGELKTKYSVHQNLNQTTIYNGSLFSGVRDNAIYIFGVNNKKLISTIKCNSPFILSSDYDNTLSYMANDSFNTFSIYETNISATNVMAKPVLLKKIKLSHSSSNITMAKRFENNVIIATKDGTIYKVNLDNNQNQSSITNTELEAQEIEPLTKKDYKHVVDIKEGNASSEFLLLVDGQIYKTNTQNAQIEKVCDAKKQTNFLTYNGKIILWSNHTINSVLMIDLETNKTQTLFTPGYHVQNIKLCSNGQKDYLVEIESKGIVNIYDFETKKYKEVYSGTGIQDVEITQNGYLYIAKTNGTYPYTPLIKVNLDTSETSPAKFSGSIAYALSLAEDKNTIYGIMFNEDINDKNTYVFSYDTTTDKLTKILQFNEEDTNAFTYMKDNVLFTNIGQNTLLSFDVKKKKKAFFKRSASLVQKVVKNGDELLILNHNGSLTVANSKKKKLLSDNYLTQENQWSVIK